MTSKEKFTAKYGQQVFVYKSLLKSVKLLKDTLNDFDGKVLNARVITALKKDDTLTKLSFELSGHSIKVGNYMDRSYPLPPIGCGYIEWNRFEFKVATDDEYRIKAAESIESLDKAVDYVKERIKTHEFNIKNFDKHEKEFCKLKAAVDAYEDKWDSSIRHNTQVYKKYW